MNKQQTALKNKQDRHLEKYKEINKFVYCQLCRKFVIPGEHNCPYR